MNKYLSEFWGKFKTVVYPVAARPQEVVFKIGTMRITRTAGANSDVLPSFRKHTNK